MAIIHINNIRIAGIAAGVPRNIVKTVSTTDKYSSFVCFFLLFR